MRIWEEIVVVDDFDFVRIVLSPDEENPPLLIDADRMLTSPVIFQGLQPVRRRDPQIIQSLRVAQNTELSNCVCLDVRRQFAAAMTGPDDRGLFIAKAGDHVGA